MSTIDISKLSKKVKEIYQVQDNTFFATPKDDWKDRIEIELGDSKEPDKVYPQFKIMRWDNEVNCSVRLLDFDN